MDTSPTIPSRLMRALQVIRTLQESLALGNQQLLMERTASSTLHQWPPQNIEVAEEAPPIWRRDLFANEAYDNLDDEDISDTLRDGALADFDSGSEVDEEVMTLKELLQILDHQDEPDKELANGVDAEFNWTQDYSTFAGTRQSFLEEVGPKIYSTSPLYIFSQLWDQTLLETIVAETNRYAWQTIAQVSECGISSHSRMNDWVETSVEEMHRLLAIIILMGICKMSRIHEYWSTGVLNMPGFSSIMSKDRYLLLMKFLHFVDNDYITDRGDDRKIAKISPLLAFLNEKFQAVYSPRQELSIDESLLLWRGLSGDQCIRTKAPRFGIKSYELCEAVSGYVMKLIIYTEKDSSNSQPIDGFYGSTAKVVLGLMKGYLGKGYTLFLDNFYNSLELIRHLKRKYATDVVGTLNRRQENTPTDIKVLDERKMPQGAVVGTHCGNISVTAWKDVELVTTVSTYHNSDLIRYRRAGRDVMKPQVVEDYNRYMGGVEMKDQKLSMYVLERKRGLKWYIKVFKRLLNISILNSYVIYCTNIGQAKKMSYRQFRYALASELCDKYGKSSSRITSRNASAYSARLDTTLNHFPDKAQTETERASAKQNKLKRARCVRCLALKKRTMANVFCSQCKAFLCVGQCWREFHTLDRL